MQIISKKSARRYQRDGIKSYLLASSLTTDSQFLTTSLVEMEPGGVQKIHSHEPEQCYFIVDGNGTMTVGEETEEVTEGDCIFVASGERHGLINSGDATLR